MNDSAVNQLPLIVSYISLARRILKNID